MSISVAICTWNRAALLDQTLTEMEKLRVPSGVEWELLVVNNNCTDDTDVVIERHAATLPIRRLYEPNPGQCNARNCAVAAAKGDLIVWTDDDVLVDPDWVASYATAVEAWPSAAFFGGPIAPWFEGEPPMWLTAALPKIFSGAYAIRDLGAEPFAFTPEVTPYGANFAVRSVVQKRYPYDPRLGLKPNGNLRGDETHMILRMLKDGLTGEWVPAAKVRHFIPKKRQTTKFLRSYCRGLGEYLAITENNNRCAMLFGRPRWIWRAAVQAELSYAFHRLFSPPEIWIEDLMRASTLWGKLFATVSRDAH